LLSADDALIDTFRGVKRQLGFEFATTPSPTQAELILRRDNYDAVFVDCDDLAGAKPLMSSLQKTPTNKNSIVVAILNGGTAAPDALDLGASSTLEKPLTPARLKDALKLAIEVLTKRQHRRVNLTVPVYLSFGDTSDRLATALNISRSGMALRCTSPLDTDESIRVKFQLPGVPAPIIARAEVAWADARGMAGIRFVSILGGGSEALNSWIDALSTRK
jgi:hypothetical protein